MMNKQTTGISANVKESNKENGIPDEYEIKDAADTLMKAHEIRNNKNLMPHVHKHLNMKKKAISSIMELKHVAKNRIMKLSGADKAMEEPESVDNKAEDKKEGA